MKTTKQAANSRWLLACVFGRIALGFLVLVISWRPVQAQTASHGMWVYRTADLLTQDPDASGLTGFSTPNHITELYLSVGNNVLSDPRLPDFLSALKGNGLRVEALIDCPDGPTCQAGTWRTRIEQVKTYNLDRSPNQIFDGIHLDLEPWANTGEDFSWAADLLSYYQDASSALEGSGLTLTADISGVKLIRLDSMDQQALLNAATRVVLMEFEVPVLDTVFARVDAFRNAVDLSGAFYAIATRVRDFGIANGCQNGNVLNQFDSRYNGILGYSGWATFRYADYNDPNICPDTCCAIGP